MKRNKFSLSHYKLLSCNMGDLIPIAMFEVLPGDTVQHATSALLRCSPLLAPVMHPVDVRIHHWYVPNRLIWENWEDFITGGPDGMDASEHPYVTLPVEGYTIGTLPDYLGLPPDVGFSASPQVSALPFRAYAKIWNENYRDQDLQTELVIDYGDGSDTTTNKTLQQVCWEKDYFTSARPWPAKGPDITIPMSGTAPITGMGKVNNVLGGAQANILEADGTLHNYAAGFGVNPASANTQFAVKQRTGGWPDVFANLSAATGGASINDLREAFALQRYEEARARYGSRYVEYLRYLGVRSSDARLQRPEYLGGGRQTIQFSEVLQTAPTTSGDDSEGVGNLKGHGITAMRSNRYRRFFEEHGIVMSLMSIRPKTIYADGIHRSWQRTTKEDYWQRELEHIGQQEISNMEVYAAATPGVFGYQDRYDEYRRIESGIAGDFRTSLDYWHYARLFGSQPALNAAFVKADPTKRVNAVPSEDVLWVMAKHSIQARRPLTRNTKSFVF